MRRPGPRGHPRGHRGRETGGTGHRWGVGTGAGGDGEPGSPPPARPGPPADSAPRRPWPQPRLTVREAAPAEAAGKGMGDGGAAAEAAAPAGGSGAEGPSRGRRGLRLQRTETAGGTRALRRRDAAAAVRASGAGPGHPPSPRQPGGERRTTPYLYLVLATAAGGVGDENNPSRSP